MLTVFRPAAAFLTAAVLLAGCGGGGGSTHATPAGPPFNAGNAPAGTAPVTLTFIIPKAPSAKQRAAQSVRGPKYITAATAAIKVTLTAVANPTTHAAVTPPGGLPQSTTFPVTSTSQNPNTPGQCGPDPANAGNVKCTETINLPLGDDTLTIATYDGYSGGNATGNIISQQRAIASVMQGVVNTFTFTLDANSGAFTVTAPTGTTVASGPNCTAQTITGASDISATCTATITGSTPVNFNVVIADAHGSTIPLSAPGAPVLSVTSSNNANFTATIAGNTLTITPHSVNVSAVITLTSTPPNTSGASPGDGLAPVSLAFTVFNVPGTTFKTRTPTGLPRQNGTATVINNILYLADGTTNPGTGYVKAGSLQQYDPSTTAWTTLAADIVPRDFASGDALFGEFYVVGGSDAGNNTIANADYFDPPTNTWFAVHAMNHSRIRHRAISINGAQLYVFGGVDETNTLVANPEAYSSDTDTWNDLAPMPTPRDDIAVASINGFIYVIGGRSATQAATTTVERYNPSTDSWATMAPLPTALRHQHAAVINGRIFVAGGYPGSGVPSANTVYFYDPAANTWNVNPGPGGTMPFPSTNPPTETSARGNNLLYIVNVGPNFDQLIELSSP